MGLVRVQTWKLTVYLGALGLIEGKEKKRGKISWHAVLFIGGM